MKGLTMLWLAVMMAAIFAASAALLTHSALPAPPRDEPHTTPLPPLWRFFWPWTHGMARWAETLLTWRARQRVARQVLRAGLSRRVTPGNVVAAQLLMAIAGAVAGIGCAAAVLPPGQWGLLAACAGAAAGAAAWVPRNWLGARGRRRLLRIGKTLPFVLDMTTLCVEAGLNLQGALQQAAQFGPGGPLRDELTHALTDMRTGATRLEAMRAMAQRVDLPAVRALVAALAQADAMGMSLGPVLRAQAEQRRHERFQRAERLALLAPVKMLFPLLACIFPCTFIVLGFPLAVQLLQALQ